MNSQAPPSNFLENLKPISLPSALPLFLSLVLIALTSAGCVSTEKRFERAVTHEESGEYIKAAKYYLDVLEREPGMKNAKEGLIRTGTIAVDNYLDLAREKEQQEAFTQAINVLDELDEFRADASRAGVDLPIEPNYSEYRGRLENMAIESLITEGRLAEQRGNWEGAINLYEQVLDEYDIDIEQREQLNLARANVYVQWGIEDIEREYFRAAFDHGSKALEILGESHPRAVTAIELQDRAIAEGTQYITFFPTTLTEELSDVAPDGLIQEFNDIMQYEFWTAPPVFIASTDPIQMRREMRRSNDDELTPLVGTQIGRLLEADYVLLSRTVQFQVDETRVRDKTVAAKTRGRNSLDTTYVHRSYTARLTAEIMYSVFEVESRDEVQSGSVKFDVSSRMERGIYSGNYRDLDLTYNEQRLFDEDELKENLRDLEDDLLDNLAPRFADEVFEDIFGLIR